MCHTWVRFTKGLFHRMVMSIYIVIFILIRLFLLSLLTFYAMATKYSLKVSAIVCWSVIFLSSTFRACISLLFLFKNYTDKTRKTVLPWNTEAVKTPKLRNELEMTTKHHPAVRRSWLFACYCSYQTELSHKHYWQMDQERGSVYSLSSEVVPRFTTGGISVLIDMDVAHNVFFPEGSEIRHEVDLRAALFCVVT